MREDVSSRRTGRTAKPAQAGIVSDSVDENIDDHLDALERSVAGFLSTAQQAPGVHGQVEYRGTTFNVTQRFVIADLAPLAFFHLVEHIEAGQVRDAVVRLHERLAPLLLCHHSWTPLKRSSDHRVIGLAVGGTRTAQGPHICKRCTAYALGTALPLVGRELAPR